MKLDALHQRMRDLFVVDLKLRPGVTQKESADMSPKYRVLEAETRLTLVREVRELIDQGWQCQGGVSITWDHRSASVVYAQAMVLQP